ARRGPAHRRDRRQQPVRGGRRGARLRSRDATRGCRARVRSLLARRPVPPANDRRHRSRTVDRARRRETARRDAAGLVGARRRYELRADHPARRCGCRRTGAGAPRAAGEPPGPRRCDPADRDAAPVDRREGGRVMRLSRRIRLIALAAAGLLLAGCTGLPTSGAPNPGLALDEEGQLPSFTPIAQGPQPGASPEGIVEGFLEAAMTPANEWEIAQEFLTED